MSTKPILKRKAIVSKKIRDSARGEECTIRFPGVCNFRMDTTVLAHINGGGTSMKSDDIEAAYACCDCHDLVDGRASPQKAVPKMDILVHHLMGCVETRRILFDKGLLKVVE